MLEIVVLILAVLLDLILGDPPNRYHPTAWMGRLISYLKPRLKSDSRKKEIKNGIIIVVTMLSVVVIVSYSFILISSLFGVISIIVSAVMLKLSIAIKSMEEHALRVVKDLMMNDIEQARKSVSMIVGRDTTNLDREHILSAVVESVGESITDGITSALFYYSLFGVPAALAYRTINTLDSMLGYRNAYHRNIGLFSAKLDTIANYIPARITALLIVLAAMIIGLNWKRGMRIMMRDKNNTPSINGGWGISSMAGVLGVRLEKIGYYSIGEECEKLEIKHCYTAIRIMKVVVLLFTLLVSAPIILLRTYLGWYI